MSTRKMLEELECRGVDAARFRESIAVTQLRPGTVRRAQRHPLDGGWVYLITGGELTKIGVSSQPPSDRIKQLQTGSPLVLEIFGAVETPYPRPIEVEAHRHHDAVRSHGEWFRLEDPAETLAIVGIMARYVDAIAKRRERARRKFYDGTPSRRGSSGL